MKRRVRHPLGAVCLLASTLLAAPLLLAGESPLRFKARLTETGVYRIAHADLVAAGLAADHVASRIRLSSGGDPVPVWRRAAGAGFGPGDEIVFVGRRLQGATSYHHEHSRHNVYLLELDGEPGPETAPAPLSGDGQPVAAATLEHLEVDRLLHRFAARDGVAIGDPWFWRRLTHIDDRPAGLDLELADLDRSRPLRIRVALRGWSRPLKAFDPPLADHVAEVRLNGTLIGRAEWQGQDETVLRVDPVPAALLAEGSNRLEISVPLRTPRRAGGGEEPLIDVSLLNWIEIERPREGRVTRDQETFRVEPAAGHLELRTDTARSLLAFSDRGGLLPTFPLGTARRHRIALGTPEGTREVLVVADERFLSPESIVLDRPSDLASTARRADYLMIAHPTLIEAVAPLAEFHARGGLEVALVDVTDVFDEFNHGVPDPRALRDFVSHAYHDWLPPAPRFVLLVGDASWDTKNPVPRSRNYTDWTYLAGEVGKSRRNRHDEYGERLPDRDLVPTWKHQGAQGHAASDNYFVAVAGDDPWPDLAIGRFPVATPEEVRAIVAKTLDYATSGVGPWRRNLLWITNESASFQRSSDQIVGELETEGFVARRVYPTPGAADNSEHQRALLQAFDEGQVLVHFLGHGGRYIWRTGPPDFRKNHDLFTLDHLEELTPSDRLPVVLSMTCYSAPFDHPTADSIGEKFLRLPDRGAVAVFAASWRNAPSPLLSRSIFRHLLDGMTLGEAIAATKRLLERHDLAETYNLLGDPALAVAFPRQRLTVEARRRGGALRLTAALPDPWPREGSRALVSWIDAAGNELGTGEIEIGDGALRLELDAMPEAAAAAAASVYLWNERRQIDAIGRVALDPAEAIAGASFPGSSPEPGPELGARHRERP